MGLSDRVALAAGLWAASLCVFAQSAAPAVPAQLQACRTLTAATASPGEWTFSGPEIANLIAAHERLSKAADWYPLLKLCEWRVPNAMAKPDEADGAILVTTEILRMTRGDIDEIAAVLAHEFGHLINRHYEKKLRKRDEAVVRAARQYGREVHDGKRREAALEQATQSFLDDFNGFSRVAEFEADDTGFALAQRAGFNASGARRIGEKFLKLRADTPTSYLSSHPGWGERKAYSERLEANERHRLVAKKAADEGDAATLARSLREWKAEVPNSGAAAYYEGLYLLMTRGSHEEVARKFEQAVAYFNGDGLSYASQSHQSESSFAQLALCVTLYREGNKQEALACVQGLGDKKDVERFKDITGWTGLIWIPGASVPDGSLFAGRGDDGTVVISNCNHVADREGLLPVRAWRPARPVDAEKAHGGYATMRCSPNSCNCEPIPPSEVPTSAVEVRR